MHGQGQQHLTNAASLSDLEGHYLCCVLIIDYGYWFPHKVCIQRASQAILNQDTSNLCSSDWLGTYYAAHAAWSK